MATNSENYTKDPEAFRKSQIIAAAIMGGRFPYDAKANGEVYYHIQGIDGSSFSIPAYGSNTKAVTKLQATKLGLNPDVLMMDGGVALNNAYIKKVLGGFSSLPLDEQKKHIDNLELVMGEIKERYFFDEIEGCAEYVTDTLLSVQEAFKVAYKENSSGAGERQR